MDLESSLSKEFKKIIIKIIISTLYSNWLKTIDLVFVSYRDFTWMCQNFTKFNTFLVQLRWKNFKTVLKKDRNRRMCVYDCSPTVVGLQTKM